MEKTGNRPLGIRILALTAVMVLLAYALFWIVRDDWDYTAVRTEPLTSSGLIPVSAGTDAVIVQEIGMDADQLEVICLVPGRLRPEVGGKVAITLKDGNGTVIRTIEADAAALRYDELNEFPLSPAITGLGGKTLRIEIDTGDTGISFQYGKSVSAGKLEVEAPDLGRLKVQGTAFEGMLLTSIRGRTRLGLSWLAPVLVGLSWLGILAFMLLMDRSLKLGKNDVFFRLSEVAKRFGYLLKKLVMRDFRVKYQASVLGVLWSFLNPLLSMFVYLFVFSTIFKSNIEHFPAYLLTGIVLFNYFSDSTTLGLNSIVTNRALITKVYMPKVIYPLAKVLSSAVNLLISFIPMFIVMLVTGVPFHKSMLLLPVVVIFIVVFCLGMSLILSTMTVFFRDTQFLWGILITVWNFLTPIFYPESIIPAAFRTVYHLNPMYQIVYFMRCITVNGVSPTPITYLYCALVSFVPLAIGLFVFRRKQDRFVLYL